MRHGKPRRGGRAWFPPWAARSSPRYPKEPPWPDADPLADLGAGVPGEPFEDPPRQPLRVGPYVPPFQTRGAVEQEEMATAQRGYGLPPGPAGGWAGEEAPPPEVEYPPPPGWGLLEPPGSDRPRPTKRHRAFVAALIVLAVVAAGAAVALLARQGARTTAAPPRGAKPAASRPAFTPLTIEAEAQSSTLVGSAQVAAYPGASGGKVVRYIGNWGQPGGPGALRMGGIVVPANGIYVLTIWYVNVDVKETTRSIIITASGPGSAVSVVSGGTACCATQIVAVFLVKGANTITFSNPHGHGPTIDKIMIDTRH